MKNKKIAIIFALICIFLWSLVPVLAKLGQVNLDNHQFIFWSSLVSFLLFISIVFYKKKQNLFLTYNKKQWLSAIGIGSLGTYFYYIFLYYGYANTEGLEVLILQYTYPIFIIIFSIFILKERINKYKILSILFGFSGAILVFTKGNLFNISFGNYFIDLLVILSAISFALFTVFSKKIKLDIYILLSIYFGFATILSFIGLMFYSNFSFPTNGEIISIIVNGLSRISFIFWLLALKNSNASFVAPFIFGVPILSSLYLIIFFDEKFLPIYIVGLILVILAGLINIKK